MSSWHSFGLTIFAQVTAITFVAAIVMLVCRGAAVRHAMGVLALSFALGSPVMVLLLPKTHWLGRSESGLSFNSVNDAAPIVLGKSVSMIRHAELPQQQKNAQGVVLKSPTPLAANRAVSVSAISAPPESEKIRLAGNSFAVNRAAWIARGFNLLGILWTIGVVISISRFVARRAQLRQLAMSLQTASIPESIVEAVRSTLGLETLPAIAVSELAPMPLVLGCLRPVVVLPLRMVATSTATQLRDVLIHECAHIVRRDPYVLTAQRLAGILFWLHPGVYWLNSAISRSREEVCDNFVLKQGNSVGYAETLLKLAESCNLGRLAYTPLGLFARRWTLEARIAGILDTRRELDIRTHRTIPLIILILLGAIALQIGGMGGTRNVAYQLATDPPKPKRETKNVGTGEKVESDTATKKEKSRTISTIDCHVQGETGKDLADAKVVVSLSVSEEKDQLATHVDKGKTLKELTYKTDSKGRYRINIPAELAENPALRLSITVTHPDYLGRTIGPLAVQEFDMQEIDKDEPYWRYRQEGRSLIANTRLRRSHPLRGRVLLSNGSPAVGAKVSTRTKYRAYSWKYHDPDDYTSEDSAITDDQGWFDIVTDSPAVLRVDAQGEAPLIIDDLGKYHSPNLSDPANTFRLPTGIRPHGQVLTCDGKPIRGAVVYASRDFKWNEFDMLTGFSRSCATDEQGRYELPPLPADAYRLSVVSRLANLDDVNTHNTASLDVTGWSRGPEIPTIPLPDVILDQTKTIGDIDATPTCDFHAVETVVITVRVEFPDGKRPDDGRSVDLTVSGMINGNRWAGLSTTAGEHGIAKLVVPRGLSNVVIGTGLARFQQTADGPIELGEAIHLLEVNRDVTGITVFRPMLAKLKDQLTLPDELSRQYAQSKAFISINAYHSEKGTLQQPFRAGKQRLWLSGATQTNSDEYRGTALPNEEIVLQVSKRVDQVETVLHEERLTLEPGEERLREIQIRDVIP